MKHAIFVVLLTASLAALAAAQPAALQQSSVTMSGKTITVKYPPLSGSQQLGAAAFPFRTDVDLEIQGLAVPKGEYTFFVVPEAGEWQLVVSTQKNATARNGRMDLGQVSMDMKKAGAPVTTLKLTLASLGRVAGKLELALGNTLASVPFSIDAVKSSAEW